MMDKNGKWLEGNALRDYFAGQIIQALLTRRDMPTDFRNIPESETLAHWAYCIATDMMINRSRDAL
jgi:hypothetical protein